MKCILIFWKRFDNNRQRPTRVGPFTSRRIRIWVFTATCGNIFISDTMSDSFWLNGSTNGDDRGQGSSNFFSAKGDNGICCWPYVCQSTIRLLYFPRMKFSLLHKSTFLLENVPHSGQDIPAVADPDLPGAVLPCRRTAQTISSHSPQIRIE